MNLHGNYVELMMNLDENVAVGEEKISLEKCSLVIGGKDEEEKRN